MKIKVLYEASPFGMVSALLCGICHSAMFALIAVYAASMNFSIFEISFVTFLIAISGIIWKIFTVGKYNLVSTILYMFMGGLWLFFLDAFISEIPPNALSWIYASCLTYLIGVFFYLADSKVKYNHFIWHIFVMLASAFHYISIYFYI